ncbi:MAG TPA: acyl-CoA dehydrogenase family protein [Acidimicrobiia bacterium]|nr:acyl-CoA dehydrogenase family protein [Acidimicrobiia bacterium]
MSAPFESVDAVVDAFRRWMAEHDAELSPFRHVAEGNMLATVEAARPLQRLLYDAGWTTLGWPEECGGRGGSPVLRAAVIEELAAAGFVVPEVHSTVEIVAPLLIRYAPQLATTYLPPALSGDERWCQGFSEPDAGSDLGSLRTRAIVDGDGFRITGSKMWSSFGHVAHRCALLARTGDPDSRTRGLTMFWVDMDAPGITVTPTMCESGREEVAEIFFDDVAVPADRVVGEVDGGWGAVMYLMQFERGAFAWQRQAELHTSLEHLIADPAALPDDAAEIVGNAYLAVLALRSQSAMTVAELAAEHDLGPEISVDKLLLGMTEQVVTDTARELLWPALELDDDDERAAYWRRKWAYSRITTIYGGVAEVQRDLVAERLLGLPRSR